MSATTDANETVVSLARDLIRIPSLTPITSDLRPAAAESLHYLKAFCEAAGARCEWLSFAGGHARWNYPVDNLHVEWGDPSQPGGLCFLGHTDVVPPGDRAAWRRDPFSGAVESGFLHGRGATDMKGAVAAFTVAAATQGAKITDGAKCPPLSLVITTDEEWAAVNGTRRVLQWMHDTGRRPSAFVVGEPSSEEHLGAAVKIGRRGSLCGMLHAGGVQGHAAYPGLFSNSNRALSLAIAILHSYRWTDGDQEMPATNFETIAMQSGDFGATAIVPGAAQALWNIRFTHHETPSTLTGKLQHLLDNPPQWVMDHPDAHLLSNVRLTANTDTAAMSYYSAPGALAALAGQIVSRNTGRTPLLDCRGGTTDGRFIHAVFPQAEIVEMGLPEAGGLTKASDAEEYGRAGGMHQVDERCSISDLQTLMWCYRDLLVAYAETGT